MDGSVGALSSGPGRMQGRVNEPNVFVNERATVKSQVKEGVKKAQSDEQKGTIGGRNNVEVNSSIHGGSTMPAVDSMARRGLRKCQP